MSAGREALAVLILGCAAWSTALGQEAPLIAQVHQRLTDAPVTRGVFEQRKSVQGFRKPLWSRGEFVVSRRLGLIWHTREPIESSLVLATNRVKVLASDGRSDTRVAADRGPAFREIGDMVLAFMAADLERLATRFFIQGQMRDGAREGPLWRLELTPRDSAFAQWVTRIELEGDEVLRVIRLHEARGDATEIALSRHQFAASLAQQEAALLE